MTVNVSDVQLGEDANITVTLPEDATGTVTVNVNGTDYYPDINNGVAILTVPASDLTVIGTYEVNVTYSGDDKYAAKDVNGSEFNVTTTANYNVNLTVVPAAEYGGDTVISVEVPSDVTGSEVIATIDGVDYVISINDEGKGSITLNNLSAGNHDITVTYPGDDKYAAVSNSSTFNIREADPKMNVTFEAIDVGQVAQVNINLPVNATGTVTVDVNGTKYDGVLVGGHVIVDVPNLGNGTYVVKVSYPGDGNYTADDFEDPSGPMIEAVKIEKPASAIELSDAYGNKIVGTYSGINGGFDADYDWGLGLGKTATDWQPFNKQFVRPLGAYIHYKDRQSHNARTISIEEPDGSTTVINSVTGDQINFSKDAIYNMNGVKMQSIPTEKGVYIQNGKKIVIK